MNLSLIHIKEKYHSLGNDRNTKGYDMISIITFKKLIIKMNN